MHDRYFPESGEYGETANAVAELAKEVARAQEERAKRIVRVQARHPTCRGQVVYLDD